MTPLNVEVGISGSASSGNQLGSDFIVTGGGGAGSSGLAGSLASVLPKVGTDQAWIVWVALALAGVVGLVLLVKLWR